MMHQINAFSTQSCYLNAVVEYDELLYTGDAQNDLIAEAGPLMVNSQYGETLLSGDVKKR